MKKIKITQIKSIIGAMPNQKKTLKALGLKRINASVELNETEQIKGMTKTVHHLIKVEPIN